MPPNPEPPAIVPLTLARQVEENNTALLNERAGLLTPEAVVEVNHTDEFLGKLKSAASIAGKRQTQEEHKKRRFSTVQIGLVAGAAVAIIAGGAFMLSRGPAKSNGKSDVATSTPQQAEKTEKVSQLPVPAPAAKQVEVVRDASSMAVPGVVTHKEAETDLSKLPVTQQQVPVHPADQFRHEDSGKAVTMVTPSTDRKTGTTKTTAIPNSTAIRPSRADAQSAAEGKRKLDELNKLLDDKLKQ